MRKIIVLLFKVLRELKNRILLILDWVICYVQFYIKGVDFKSFQNNGYPLINISHGGKFNVGANFRSNNRVMSNPIGRFHRCSFVVGKGAILNIGSNVGISGSAIVCHNRITIGHNVRIGGNTVIYDTDFHSLNQIHRLNTSIDKANTNTKPIIIEDNVFIGAHATILKGVVIGENSIIGACSVVVKDIPKNEIWAGNPAKKIKAVKDN